MLDFAWAERWTRLAAARIAADKDELTELDRQIGDGDHGENLNRGFMAVVAKLDRGATPDGTAGFRTIGDILRLVATTLMSTVGGAAGPLYGTAYLRAAKAAEAREPDAAGELDGTGVVAVLKAALEGIQARGKAVTGEKTMVDAWFPAVDAAQVAAVAGTSPRDVLAAAAEAAARGAEATIPLIATKGRASYLGERAVGHQDPGATSTALILAAAVAAADGATQ